MTTEERAALEAFVAGVRAHNGARLVDIFVFGSRARGDATPDSDVDLAIILRNIRCQTVEDLDGSLR